jgi:hypothetical protein
MRMVLIERKMRTFIFKSSDSLSRHVRYRKYSYSLSLSLFLSLSVCLTHTHTQNIVYLFLFSNVCSHHFIDVLVRRFSILKSTYDEMFTLHIFQLRTLSLLHSYPIYTHTYIYTIHTYRYPEELTIQRKVFAITGISIFVQVVHVVHILRADRV